MLHIRRQTIEIDKKACLGYTVIGLWSRRCECRCEVVSHLNDEAHLNAALNTRGEDGNVTCN